MVENEKHENKEVDSVKSHPEEEKTPPHVVMVPLHKVRGHGHGPVVPQHTPRIRVGGVQKPELGPRQPFTNPEDNNGKLVDKSNEMRAENDFPRPPQLKRHRSMADVARIHKQNGITNSLDYRQMPDTNLNYSPPPVVVSPDMPASDGPNFLLRVGPQVFMNAGRDTSISTVNNEVSLRSDLGDLILKVCESSDDNGDSDVPIDSTSKKSRFWDFLMDDLLGFQSRARSPDEKRKQREANMEICDPVLLLAFALWLA